MGFISIFSPLYWLVTIVLFVGIIWFMWTYVHYFIHHDAELKNQMGEKYGVEIVYDIFSNWHITSNSWENYQGDKWAMLLDVEITRAKWVAAFVLGLLVFFVVIIGFSALVFTG